MLTKDNFKSKQEVKWCPGCGDYAILATLQKTLPLLNIPKENFAFISGIGCSGRLPYYLDVYGFHTLHGRAPTIATGLKLTRPDLSVWIVTGDGDGLSIGSNHLLHLLRRNVDVKIIFINNKIYGLTKGQYSPTSDLGTITPTSPQGSNDHPVNPIKFALAAGATFVARTIDTNTEHLQETLLAAANHKGSAFIEIYQNCIIFNNNAFASIRDKKYQSQNCLFMQPSKPLRFGQTLEKGLCLNNLKLEISENNDSILSHDTSNDTLAFLLSALNASDFPIPLGIFKQVQQPVFSAHSPLNSQANSVVLCQQFIDKKINASSVKEK